MQVKSKEITGLDICKQCGKITENYYRKDNSLVALIGMLPYGIENEKEVDKSDNPILNISDNIKSTDKVLIWAGGIWNWFDTESLIYAMKMVSDERKNIKLLFLGGPPKNSENNPKYKKFYETYELAKKLNLINKSVFFNKEWVEYEKRWEYLINSYAGISLHYNNVETRFSYRTRILDYIWSELPFITSEGDFFAEICSLKNLGQVVNYSDADSIKNNIIYLVDNEKGYNEKKENIRMIKKNFYWNIVCDDLIKNIESENKTKCMKIGILKSLFFFFQCAYEMFIAIVRKDF